MGVIYLGNFMRTNQVGLRILQALEEIGMNQSELARATGVVPQSVQQWVRQPDPRFPKRKINNPTGESVRLLAKALKKSESWILFGVDGNHSELSLALLEIMKELPDTQKMDVINYAKLVTDQLIERLRLHQKAVK